MLHVAAAIITLGMMLQATYSFHRPYYWNRIYRLHQKVTFTSKIRSTACTIDNACMIATWHSPPPTQRLATLASSTNRQFKVKTSIFLFLSGARLLHVPMQPPNYQHQPVTLPNRLDKTPSPYQLATIKQAYHSAPTQQLGKVSQSGFSPGSS